MSREHTVQEVHMRSFGGICGGKVQGHLVSKQDNSHIGIIVAIVAALQRNM